MDDTAKTEHHTDCEPLLELATPQIYRRNLFRVLGLSVNANPRDVQRQQNRRKMQEKLGIAISSNGHGRPLSLDPPPSDEDIRAAIERLNRPMDRLLDEVFWFWPTNGNVAGDPALKALAQGQVKKANEIWTGQADLGGLGQIAAHNLAVLYHLTALDHETRLTSRAIDKEKQGRLSDLWIKAFARWKQVFDGEEFWALVKNRVRELNDLQLTTGFVRRVRGTLPTALLLVNANIAYDAAERCDAALAQRHIQLLRKSAFGDGLADKAIEESLKPIRNRIKTAVDKAKSHWASTPHQGNRHIHELLEQANSLLSVADVILPEGNLARVGLHDMVADAVLEGQIAFGAKTNDWPECIKLIEMAKNVASSETVRSRLSENLEILQKNAKQGNDWCCPGYWDLPQEIVAQLEAARDKSKAGDYEGAIRNLVVMDPKIGRPLRRCIAFCLSQRGWQIALEGLNEFRNKPTSKIQIFLEVINRRGTIPVPHPQMSSWQLPDCPCCGRRNYTSWVNGEYNGQRYWMCSSCSESDAREQNERRRKLRPSVSEGLEYVLLADEIDRGDPDIAESIKTLKKIAGDIEASIPQTKALKQRLGAHKTRRVHHTFEPTPADLICHFCGENTAGASCQITVPMCGDIHAVDLLFHKGIEYRCTNIVIPRCHRCRDEHRELPDRVEKWYEARSAAADDEHFPKAAHEVKVKSRAAREAVSVVEQNKLKVVEAQAEMEKAKAVGGECGRCNSGASWKNGLCRQCDSKFFRLSRPAKIGLAAVIVLTCVSIFILQSYLSVLSPLTDFVAAKTEWSAYQARQLVDVLALAFSLFIGFVLAGGLKRRQWRRRRELREQRQTEIQQRRNSAIDEAQKLLDQAKSLLASAEQAAQKPIKALEDAKNKLKAAKDVAVAEFERVYPEPRLITGVKAESVYTSFGRLVNLRERGWGFGHEVIENGQKIGDYPTNVTGLVSREPRPTPERVAVTCPECGMHQRVPKRDNAITVNCSCGHHFDCRNGMVRSAALKAKNIEHWKNSGEPEKWVEAHNRSWGHEDWLKLLESLKQSQYWPMDEDQVGQVLESIKNRVLDNRKLAVSHPSNVETCSHDPRVVAEKPRAEKKDEWDDRVLCEDEACIGTIGPDGRCKECRKAHKGKLPENLSNSRPSRESEASKKGIGKEDNAQIEAVESSWEERALCNDGNCIGVIGLDGKCKECGKPYLLSAEP